MKSKLKVPPFAEEKGVVNVIVESPKGGRNKYKIDRETGLLALSKVLPSGMNFPFDFGSIPSTVAEDGDPLDVLILLEEPVVPLCLAQARMLGVIKAEQTEKGKTVRNDRIIGIAIYKNKPAELDHIKHLDPQTLKEVERFFVSYNKLEGREFKVLDYEGPKSAAKLVKQAHKRFYKSK